MKKQRKVILLTTLFLVLSIGLYHSFRGRLHPFCPWVIGFDKLETRKAVLYYHADCSTISCLLTIDSLINTVEKTHELSFKRKVEVVVSADRKEHERYSGSSGTFITQPLKGRIYLPYLEEYFAAKVQPLHTYLQHELSHSLIYQNISISRLWGYPLWFLEGLATYSADMAGVEGYPSKDTVWARISEGCFIHPNDWGRFGMPVLGASVKQYPYPDTYYFAYSEFSCMVDDLVRKYGKEKMIKLLHASIRSEPFKSAFSTIYTIQFEDYLSGFHKPPA